MKEKIAFVLIMGVITTALISFTLVSINNGFERRFLIVWFRSWAIAYILAVFSMLFIAPKIQQFVSYIFRKDLIEES